MTDVTTCRRQPIFVVMLFGATVTCACMFILRMSIYINGVNLCNNPVTGGVERQLYNEGDEEMGMALGKYTDDRLRRLRRECQHHHQQVATSHGFGHMIVDDKYKMLFCFIPKISCSQWKFLFVEMTRKVKNTRFLNLRTVHTQYRQYLSYLNRYNTEDQTKIINEYKKYIVVRNPLERLLSAYRNKFAGSGFSDPAFQTIGRTIVRRFRPNATQTSLKLGNDVTFLEFVKYITDNQTTRFNNHWERYTELCQPCLIKYDFVGKYETLNRDADFILKDIGAPSDIQFPKRPEEYYQTEETKKVFEKFYSQIPLEYITKLRQIYKYDFDFFGYSVPGNLQASETKP